MRSILRIGLLLMLGGCDWIRCDDAKPAQGEIDASKPFEGELAGTIRSDSSVGALFPTHVRYVIAKKKIKREVDGQALAGGTSAGVIVDLEKEEVTLYRRVVSTKKAVKLTLAEYERAIGEKTWPDPTPTDNGYGSIYLELPDPQPEEIKSTETDAEHFGQKCHTLLIERGLRRITTEHCPGIRVDRKLVELVELRLPARAEGFPIMIALARLTPVSVPATDGGPSSKTGDVLKRVVREVEKLVSSTMELEQVRPYATSEADFTIAEGFELVATLALFAKAFEVEGGGDWD